METANHNSFDIRNIYITVKKSATPASQLLYWTYLSTHIVSDFRILLYTELKNALAGYDHSKRKTFEKFRCFSYVFTYIFVSAAVRRFVCSISNNKCDMKATLKPFHDVRKLLYKCSTTHIYAVSGSIWKALHEYRSHSLLQFLSHTPM